MVVKRHVKIVHKRQNAGLMPLQAVKQVLGWALLLATTFFLACCWWWGCWIGSQPLFEQAQRTRFIRKLLVC